MIYIAGPLFTETQRNFLEHIDEICKKRGYSTYLPHRDGGLWLNTDAQTIFERDTRALKETFLLIAVLDRKTVDDGTAFEMGCAYTKNIPIIGILTEKKDTEKLNIMIKKSVKKICVSLRELNEELRKNEYKK